MKTPAQLRLADNRAGRLLPHVLEVTAHAQRLRAVPDRAVRLLTTVGNNLRDVGQLDISHQVLDRALAIAQAQLGPDHPHTLITRGDLASMLGAAGQPSRAAAQYRDLLTDFLRVLGPGHPDTLATRHNLALWLGEAGQPDQAAGQFHDLLTDQLRVLGPDHSHTLTARANLAFWLGAAGQPDQAAAQYRDLLDDYLRVLGPDHPDTLTTRGNLALWLGEAGQPDQAAAQLRDWCPCTLVDRFPLCRIYIRNVNRFLKAHRTQFPQAALFPDAVVIPLDVVEYRGPGLFGIQP